MGRGLTDSFEGNGTQFGNHRPLCCQSLSQDKEEGTAKDSALVKVLGPRSQHAKDPPGDAEDHENF